ncbi:hypothetical protein TVAGG3_0610800 [Trichomonas vaginalis G3]|uniref:hypothetical protein n=1 Tax=Trichomonas vaginalis (strain ATCC PRA-98 / G3) TaxID=412133 RepID=UPI0021E5BE2A|nr:hypothetical protein TVAGG3_0610800 [Trichomonas vaginalis G3]KAI5524576.1 hypothetical protein TVAGG3_0610800 [Trichomonas vaginalis G3]
MSEQAPKPNNSRCPFKVADKRPVQIQIMHLKAHLTNTVKTLQSSLMEEMKGLKGEFLMNQASNEKVLNDLAETLRIYARENRDLARLIYRFFEEIDAIWKVLGKDRTCNTVLREYQIEEGIIKEEEEEEEEEEEKHEEEEVWQPLLPMTLTKFPTLPIQNPQQGDRQGSYPSPQTWTLDPYPSKFTVQFPWEGLSVCNGFQIQTRRRRSDTLTVTSSTTVRRTRVV